MKQETELFFGSIIREDRNVMDLLTADYTFLNERLARHYGIPGVYGSQFRRVHIDDEASSRTAGAGQHPDRDVLRRSHIARTARQVDSYQHPGCAAARRLRRTCRN